jgi:hypothetical protein
MQPANNPATASTAAMEAIQTPSGFNFLPSPIVS